MITNAALARASRHIARFTWHKQHGSTHATVARDLLIIRAATETMIERTVFAMRDAGWTWAEVGDALDITDATARRRYGLCDTLIT